MALFESYERREKQILEVLSKSAQISARLRDLTPTRSQKAFSLSALRMQSGLTL